MDGVIIDKPVIVFYLVGQIGQTVVVDGETKESGSISSTKIEFEYEIDGNEKEIKKIAEKRLNEIINLPLKTATAPLQIQVIKDNIRPYNLRTENKIKGIKNKVHKASLSALEKVVKSAVKVGEGEVDTQHNTSKKTIAHKQKVDKYVYFKSPIKIKVGDEYFYYDVKLVTEQIKGQDKNLLDLYHIEIGRPRSTSRRTNSSGVNMYIAQNNENVNIKKISKKEIEKRKADRKGEITTNEIAFADGSPVSYIAEYPERTTIKILQDIASVPHLSYRLAEELGWKNIPSSIVDSIQTMVDSEISSVAGSISQVKEVTARLMYIAKRKNITEREARGVILLSFLKRKHMTSPIALKQ